MIYYFMYIKNEPSYLKNKTNKIRLTIKQNMNQTNKLYLGI